MSLIGAMYSGGTIRAVLSKDVNRVKRTTVMPL